MLEEEFLNFQSGLQRLSQEERDEVPDGGHTLARGLDIMNWHVTPGAANIPSQGQPPWGTCLKSGSRVLSQQEYPYGTVLSRRGHPTFGPADLE